MVSCSILVIEVLEPSKKRLVGWCLMFDVCVFFFCTLQNRDYKLLYWNPYQSTSNKRIGSDRCVFVGRLRCQEAPMNELRIQPQAWSVLQVNPYIFYLGQPLLGLLAWNLVPRFICKMSFFLASQKLNKNRSCARLALIQRAFLQQMCLQLGFLLEVCGRKVDLRKSYRL